MGTDAIQEYQVYRNIKGEIRIIGDRWNDGRWAVSGPIQPGDVKESRRYWVTDLASPDEIQSWTYVGNMLDMVSA